MENDIVLDKNLYNDRRTSERRSVERRTGDRRMSERREGSCPLQEQHIAAIADIGARLTVVENKVDAVDRIDKNLEILTALYKNSDKRQEESNKKFTESITALAERISAEKAKGSITFNDIFQKLIWIVLGGGAFYTIFTIAKKAIGTIGG